MNQIFLPNLRSIEINNYTLYPNGLDFKYDFVHGVNLIMGGNGMGKTTFVNILKYAIIGHYKNEFDYTRTYKNRKIEKRIAHPFDYFKSRAGDSNSLKSSVKIKFEVNQTLFCVERYLNDISIKSVSVKNDDTEIELLGELIPQSKYDSLGAGELELKEKTLQYKYEKELEKCLGITFDDLIFFVNRILFFGEDHKTILWNENDDDVQMELFNKYFNNPELNQKREEAKRFAQYYNTQARHRSEDIRVIKNVLKKVSKDTPEGHVDSLNEVLLKLKEEIGSLNQQIDFIQSERVNNDEQISILNNQFNGIGKKIDELEVLQKNIEQQIFKNRWVNKNDKYDLYIQNMQANETCPMCNQEVEEHFIRQRTHDSNNCFLCNQVMNDHNSNELQEELSTLVANKNELYVQRADKLSEIYVLEDKQKIADGDFNKAIGARRLKSSKLRNLEYTANEKENDGEKDQLQAFYDEIEALEILKEENHALSFKQKEIENSISAQITETITKNVNRFSNLFSGFAEKFLGVECSLTYEALDGNLKRFYPIINGQVRRHEEELSESQRFFIDHSFRMSILSFFYTKPSFYIVETPDSSLDISYEHNAADVFIKFLENPYSLIITSNLNNSEFLNYLSETSVKIGVINLIELGKQSKIQNNSPLLKTIYESVIKKISRK